MKPKLRDRQGTEVLCGKMIAQGGEGSIYEIQGHSKFVAKIYHVPPDKDKTAKLEAMVAAKTERLLRLAAWPVEVLIDRRGSRPVGIVMPKMRGYKDIHLLYGPRSRLREFPMASWPFLIQTASNLARSFAVIHDHGHVIGDVNDKVALVNEQAKVRLIDCDGFQITSKGRTFSCDVGVLTHQPPEHQDIPSFRGLHRTQNHDNFGLAVLIFQLLFMARHPFSGTFQGKGEMPLERSIHESRFVYGKNAAAMGMSPPPLSLDLSAVTTEISNLFERAFAPDSNKKKRRPSAKEWADGLQALAQSVRRCRTNPSHAFLRGSSCPFCAIESQSGSTLFNLPILFKTSGGRKKTKLINLSEIWKDIRTIEGPGDMPVLEGIPKDARAAAPKKASASRSRFVLGTSLASVMAGLGLIPVTGYGSLSLLAIPALLWPFRKPRVSGRLKEARRAWEEALRSWQQEASPRRFNDLLLELKAAKKDLEGLDEVHEERMRQLDTGRREHQLEAFLDKHRIADSAIPGISSAATVVLESYGIETAKDVDPRSLGKVPGLGAVGRKTLLNWRQKLEAGFKFDPNKGVSPMALATVEREIQKRRAQLVQRLVDGPAKLRFVAQQIGRRRKSLKASVEQAWRDLEQAKKAA